MRPIASFALVAALAGCRVLSAGLTDGGTSNDAGDLAGIPGAAEAAVDDATPVIDEGEPPGVAGAPGIVGCSDGTREGFRDLANWPAIAGCSGAFDQPGVLGSPDLAPLCGRQAGDTSVNPSGTACGAADLCAEQWHVCRNGSDVAQHSSSGGCEGCLPAGELRLFVVAAGASAMGICSPDPEAANDLHGCGGLGEPEADGCAPLGRRMGFADCRDTQGVWSCGEQSDNLREAAVVTKHETAMGGVLCCRD